MRVCPGCETATEDAGHFCPACGEVFPLSVRDDASVAETQPVAPATPSLVGSVVDGFAIEAILGSGSFGTVFRGRQLGLDRIVAIKVPTHEIAIDPIMAKRFAREARAAARVSHPGVVTIHQVGELPDGRPYLAMQLVEGEPLDKIIKAGPLEPGRALAIARLVASALSETHAADVVHRDLKPSNIMWRRDRTGDDRITIVDFGIAVCRPGTADATRLTSGGLIGTPHYMSPEQCHGEHVDHRSDLYALGCVLFELLTGTVPFTGSGFEVLLAHMGKPAPTVAERLAELAAKSAPTSAPAASVATPSAAPSAAPVAAIDRLVARLLEKKPEDRPADAAEVVALIDALELADPATEPRLPRAKRKTALTVHDRPPPAARPPSWRVGAVVAALALSATGFAAVMLAREPAAGALVASDDGEPLDSRTDPTTPDGSDRRQIVDDDGEFTMRVLLPDPIQVGERVGFHIEIWNKLGQPIDAPDLVVTVEDPHGTAAGLSAKGHGEKEKRHFGFHHRFAEPGHYNVRIFPPGSSSMFQLDVDVER